MEISTVLTLLGILIGTLLGIPQAVAALRDLGWIPSPTPDSVPAQTYPSLEVPATDQGERVLLTLKPNRAATPGTVEYDLMSFENRLPLRHRSSEPLTGLNNLIWNPWLLRWSASSRLRANRIGIVFLLLLGAAMGVMTLASPSGTLKGAVGVFIGFLFMIGAIIAALYFDGRKAQKVVGLVDEYQHYLRANQISIGAEMTQSKPMYEKRGVVSVAA